MSENQIKDQNKNRNLPVTTRVKLTLHTGERFFGPGVCELLERIRTTGSIQAPAAARGELCCGMSLLVGADMIDRAKAVILRENAVYHSIVSLENQLQPRRDRYC